MSTTKTKASIQNVYLVGIDVGFGETKVVSSTGKVFTAPSTVEKGQKSTSGMLRLSAIDEESLIVTTQDGTFHVGKQAMKINKLAVSSRTIIKDRASDERFRALFQTLTALALPDRDGEFPVYIQTGLPNDDFDSHRKEALEEFIGESFEVEFHLGREKSIKKKIIVQGYEIVRQPEGSITYRLFEIVPGEFLVYSDNFKQRVGIIDIGHLTTDFALFEDGIIVENNEFMGSALATHEMYKKLQNNLKVKFRNLGLDYDAPDEDLDVAVRTKLINFAGSDHDVSGEVADAALSVADSIAKVVLDKWGQQANRQNVILITGGGAEIFTPYLQDAFRRRNTQVPVPIHHSQVANVFGFYMLGALNLADKFGVDVVYRDYIDPVFGGK
jgi:hypothetical protein